MVLVAARRVGGAGRNAWVVLGGRQHLHHVVVQQLNLVGLCVYLILQALSLLHVARPQTALECIALRPHTPGELS